MSINANTYSPNYTVSPGEILEEMLETRSIKKKEFADACGRSSKMISQIIAGDAPVTPETAILFERVLGVKASLWSNLETNYRLFLAEEAEREKLSQQVEWSKQFPIKQMKKFGLLPEVKGADLVNEVLDFFAVGSVEAWENRIASQPVAFKASKAFESKPHAVAAWLRWGAKDAASIECNPYDAAKFKNALKEIRILTTKSPKEFQKPLKELCRDAGVVVLWRPELDGTRLSGAARWLSSDKALIQLSLRNKTDDHFWFSFFHEAAHILLHSKKEVFIDSANDVESDDEREANDFAQKFLVPRKEWNSFVLKNDYTEKSVKAFADSIGISYGIVVGQLQHEGYIDFSKLHWLKRKFQWTNEAYN
jgi:HTH-type transcriptional regulator / antitoxin HigA